MSNQINSSSNALSDPNSNLGCQYTKNLSEILEGGNYGGFGVILEIIRQKTWHTKVVIIDWTFNFESISKLKKPIYSYIELQIPDEPSGKVCFAKYVGDVIQFSGYYFRRIDQNSFSILHGSPVGFKINTGWKLYHCQNDFSPYDASHNGMKDPSDLRSRLSQLKLWISQYFTKNSLRAMKWIERNNPQNLPFNMIVKLISYEAKIGKIKLNVKTENGISYLLFLPHDRINHLEIGAILKLGGILRVEMNILISHSNHTYALAIPKEFYDAQNFLKQVKQIHKYIAYPNYTSYNLRDDDTLIAGEDDCVLWKSQTISNSQKIAKIEKINCTKQKSRSNSKTLHNYFIENKQKGNSLNFSCIEALESEDLFQNHTASKSLSITFDNKQMELEKPHAKDNIPRIIYQICTEVKNLVEIRKEGKYSGFGIVIQAYQPMFDKEGVCTVFKIIDRSLTVNLRNGEDLKVITMKVITLTMEAAPIIRKRGDIMRFINFEFKLKDENGELSGTNFGCVGSSWELIHSQKIFTRDRYAHPKLSIITDYSKFQKVLDECRKFSEEIFEKNTLESNGLSTKFILSNLIESQNYKITSNSLEKNGKANDQKIQNDKSQKTLDSFGFKVKIPEAIAKDAPTQSQIQKQKVNNNPPGSEERSADSEGQILPTTVTNFEEEKKIDFFVLIDCSNPASSDIITKDKIILESREGQILKKAKLSIPLAQESLNHHDLKTDLINSNINEIKIVDIHFFYQSVSNILNKNIIYKFTGKLVYVYPNLLKNVIKGKCYKCKKINDFAELNQTKCPDCNQATELIYQCILSFQSAQSKVISNKKLFLQGLICSNKLKTYELFPSINLSALTIDNHIQYNETFENYMHEMLDSKLKYDVFVKVCDDEFKHHLKDNFSLNLSKQIPIQIVDLKRDYYSKQDQAMKI